MTDSLCLMNRTLKVDELRFMNPCLVDTWYTAFQIWLSLFTERQNLSLVKIESVCRRQNKTRGP